MKISGGGTLAWSPQVTSVSSELFSVALSSGSKSDTIAFIIHVNKDRTTIGIFKKSLYPIANAESPKVAICVNSTGALFFASSDRFDRI